MGGESKRSPAPASDRPLAEGSARIARTMAKAKSGRRGKTSKVAEGYTHPDQTLLMRPEVGTQAQFKKKQPPATYRYDSSLSPSLDWDGGNGARELGDWLLGVIERAAAFPPPHALPAPEE